jgi:hypothetical protein
MNQLFQSAISSARDQRKFISYYGLKPDVWYNFKNITNITYLGKFVEMTDTHVVFTKINEIKEVEGYATSLYDNTSTTDYLLNPIFTGISFTTSFDKLHLVIWKIPLIPTKHNIKVNCLSKLVIGNQYFVTASWITKIWYYGILINYELLNDKIRLTFEISKLYSESATGKLHMRHPLKSYIRTFNCDLSTFNKGNIICYYLNPDRLNALKFHSFVENQAVNNLNTFTILYLRIIKLSSREDNQIMMCKGIRRPKVAVSKHNHR